MEPTATDSALLDPPAADDRAVADGAAPTADDAHVEDELLVEEISIDGMCGVY